MKAIHKWLQFNEDDELGSKSFSEKVLYWSIVLTPLWWLLGIQILFFPTIAVGLLIHSFNFDKLFKVQVPNFIWIWLAFALVTLWATALGLVDVGFLPLRVAASLVNFLKGYFLIFACLFLPFWSRIRIKVVVRAVAWLAIGYGITAILQFVILTLGVWNEPIYPPLARLIPGDKLSLLVKPAVYSPFLGIPLPRTSLYTADPPIPGVCGLLCFFICSTESNCRLRWLSITGSLIALLVSQSRLAWICFPLAFLIAASFRSRLAREGSLWGMAALFMVCAMLGITLVDLQQQALATFTEARAASSTDRAFVLAKTIEAWQERPWLGWGISQGTAKWYTYNIALGSFSTYIGVLYLSGILGLISLISALSSTLWHFWVLAIQGRHLAQLAFASFAALCIFIEGLPLSWMCVYFWFYFIWLGAILRETGSVIPTASKWEELRLKH